MRGCGRQAGIDRLGLALLLAVAGSQTASALEPPKARRLEIVDRAIEFHGGEVYTRSATSLRLCSASGCFDVEAKVEGGTFDHVVSGSSRGVARKVRIDNDTVEVWENGEPIAVELERRQAYRDWVMARVYFCFLPFRLNDDSVYKRDLGLEEWNGRRLHKVEVTFEPDSSTDAGDQYLYWFDPDTGRLEQFAYSFTGNPGGLRFRRAFNYRRISGILFFDQENWGAEGGELAVGDLDPAAVKRLRRVSTVELRQIAVRPVSE